MRKPRRGEPGALGASTTDQRTDAGSGRRGPLRRSRAGVTSRATMSDRPRAGTRHGRTYRLAQLISSDRLPVSGGDRRVRGVTGRWSTSHRPVRAPSRSGPQQIRAERAWYAPVDPSSAIGRFPHPGPGRRRHGPAGYTRPRSEGSVEGPRKLGRSCDRAIRARRPSRETADRPAGQPPQRLRRPAGDLQPAP